MRDAGWYIAFLVIVTLASFQVWAMLGHLADRVTGKQVEGVQCREVIKDRLERLTTAQPKTVGTSEWGEYRIRIDECLVLLDSLPE